ncbi:MAG: Glycosyltransferase family 2 protein [Parachlamydiales bacterium]|nr:Glycosyltransferase family 2 protein [Parachlamydiales bacterium]
MRFPKVLILILNWNGKSDTLECLASLSAASPKPLFSTLIVDNGSTDDSVASIRAAFPDVPIIETNKNLGFAGGNNVGIRWALGKSFDWILLLNNDTIVDPHLIDGFMEAAKKNPSAKILGAKIYRYHDRERIDHLGGLWDPLTAEFTSIASDKIDDGSFEEMQKVGYVCGCALFMHRSVPETIGLLEEKFFLLWEESDFCARAARAGFEIWTAPKAKLWHKVSASFTGGKAHTHYFWWRNRLLWIERNCDQLEKRQIYRNTIIPEICKHAKLAVLKTLQILVLHLLGQRPDEARLQKARRYRAGCRGILHYFLGRFGNCPTAYIKRRKNSS